jgi:hypothetical protein
VIAADPTGPDEPAGAQPSRNSYSVTVSDVTFGTASTECPDASARWRRMTDHLAGWLVAEWQREQAQARQLRKPDSTP